ncbi:MAG: class I SAM-dependent methyltransferase [Cyanobacteria bacterium P01_D01_bin.156]
MNDQDLRQQIKGYAQRPMEQRKRWYSSAAEAYDQVRPHYPISLINRVVDIAQISSHSSILEIGCGPATATVSFAPLGCSITCLEPNSEFTRLAQQNCQPYPNITIKNVSFEEWPLSRGCFDYVLAATSFHWIPAEVGYAKAASALNDNGKLILLWNKELQPNHRVYQQLANIYQHHAPELARYEDLSTQQIVLDSLGNLVLESGHFQEMVSERVTTQVTYSSSEYLALLTTYSPYLQLSASTRQALFKDLKIFINETLGGKLELAYTSAFHIAQKK